MKSGRVDQNDRGQRQYVHGVATANPRIEDG